MEDLFHKILGGIFTFFFFFFYACISRSLLGMFFLIQRRMLSLAWVRARIRLVKWSTQVILLKKLLKWFMAQFLHMRSRYIILLLHCSHHKNFLFFPFCGEIIFVIGLYIFLLKAAAFTNIMLVFLFVCTQYQMQWILFYWWENFFF